MNFTVINKEVNVGYISILGISSSSICFVGDTESITLTSIFDTPADSLIIGPFVPLSPE